MRKVAAVMLVSVMLSVPLFIRVSPAQAAKPAACPNTVYPGNHPDSGDDPGTKSVVVG